MSPVIREPQREGMWIDFRLTSSIYPYRYTGTIGLAFGRTMSSSSGPMPAIYINIEAHSVAFSGE